MVVYILDVYIQLYKYFAAFNQNLFSTGVYNSKTRSDNVGVSALSLRPYESECVAVPS